MSLAQTVSANVAAARTQQGQPTVKDLIRSQLPRMRQVLPATMTAERLANLVLNEVPRNPQLAECTPESLVGSVMRVAQLGLELGPDLGQAWLIPRRNKGVMEATMQIGFRGYIELARRSGRLRDIYAAIVHERDEFSYRLGLHRDLTHVPYEGEDAGPLTHAYAVAEFTDGGFHFEVLSKAQIDQRRSFGRSGDSGPWASHYEAMARKSAIKAMVPYLPLTPDAMRAFAHDERVVKVLDGELVTESDDAVAALPAPAVEEPADPETGEVAGD